MGLNPLAASSPSTESRSRRIRPRSSTSPLSTPHRKRSLVLRYLYPSKRAACDSGILSPKSFIVPNSINELAYYTSGPNPWVRTNGGQCRGPPEIGGVGLLGELRGCTYSTNKYKYSRLRRKSQDPWHSFCDGIN